MICPLLPDFLKEKGFWKKCQKLKFLKNVFKNVEKHDGFPASRWWLTPREDRLAVIRTGLWIMSECRPKPKDCLVRSSENLPYLDHLISLGHLAKRGLTDLVHLFPPILCICWCSCPLFVDHYLLPSTENYVAVVTQAVTRSGLPFESEVSYIVHVTSLFRDCMESVPFDRGTSFLLGLESCWLV